ncbi:MAG: hypothetical protein JRN21_06190 [Nitrososphaerota archaeon]|nr:hypothetical protein [Nitrososphaerota archaeon]
MHPPDELMSEVFLPSVRQLVAARLRSRGYSQNRIGSLLGTTQASVSVYLSSDQGRAYSLLSRLSVSKAEADRYADLLAEAAVLSPVDGVRALADIWDSLLARGWACPAHREMYPDLSGCDVCLREYGGSRSSRAQAVAEVKEAVKMLEASPWFVAVMPEVSVNVACAPDDAESPSDVVAVPGRIVRVRDRAKGMLPPEAGASAHMAKVLLLARARRPAFRACINLRYDGAMAAVMKKAGLKAVVLGGDRAAGHDDPTVEALAKKLGSRRGAFDAVVDEGGAGIEPNVYLFSGGAREVAELAIRLAKGYSAG